MVSLFLPGTCRQRDGHLLSPALSSTSWKRGRRTRPRRLIQLQWGQGEGVDPVVFLLVQHLQAQFRLEKVSLVTSTPMVHGESPPASIGLDNNLTRRNLAR